MELKHSLTVGEEATQNPTIFKHVRYSALAPASQYDLLRDKLASYVDSTESNGFFKEEAITALSESFRSSFEDWYQGTDASVVKWAALLFFAAKILQRIDVDPGIASRFKSSGNYTLSYGMNNSMIKYITVEHLGSIGPADVKSNMANLLSSRAYMEEADASTFLLHLGPTPYNSLLLHSVFYTGDSGVDSQSLIYNLGTGIYFTNCSSYINSVILKMMLSAGHALSDLSLLILKIPSNWLLSQSDLKILEKEESKEWNAVCLKSLRDPGIHEASAILAKGICNNSVKVARCDPVRQDSCTDLRCLCQNQGFELCIKFPRFSVELLRSAAISLVSL